MYSKMLNEVSLDYLKIRIIRVGNFLHLSNIAKMALTSKLTLTMSLRSELLKNDLGYCRVFKYHIVHFSI